MMKKISYILIFLLGVVFFVPAGLDAQCAMCGASVQSSQEGSEIAAGLNSGILYLLAIPYLIFMTFAFIIYRTVKRNKQTKQATYFQN